MIFENLTDFLWHYFYILVIGNSNIKNMKGNWIIGKIIKQVDVAPCYTGYLIYHKYLRYSKTHSCHLHIIKQLSSRKKIFPLLNIFFRQKKKQLKYLYYILYTI